MKKIAVDAMGGDYAPQAIVEGVNQALADFSDIEIQLYGDESKIKQELRKFMDQIYEEYVGIHLKSKKFIDSLADWGQLLKEEDK